VYEMELQTEPYCYVGLRLKRNATSSSVADADVLHEEERSVRDEG